MTTSDVWSAPEASLAAVSVFRLAEEEPLLRPSNREATDAAAAALGEWTGESRARSSRRSSRAFTATT